MDKLDLLKKDWNKEQQHHKNFSRNDIYSMLHKKSSSIVKFLFYISIGELILWLGVNSLQLFYSEEYKNKINATFGDDIYMIGATVVSYAIILLFIYLLHRAYQKINATSNVKTLMENIINTRKVIKYYVSYNLIMLFIGLVYGFYVAIHKEPKVADMFSHYNEQQTFKFLVIISLVIAVTLVCVWLFYKLLYGLLIKKLNKNYKELKDLE